MKHAYTVLIDPELRIEYNRRRLAEHLAINEPQDGTVTPIAMRLQDLYNGGTFLLELGKWIYCSLCAQGRSQTYACRACSGCGVRPTKATISFTVPKGSRNGNHIIIAGQGNRLYPLSKADDVILEVVEQDDPNFQRIGNDLYYTVYITSSQARREFLLKITHLDARELKLRFKPSELKPGRNRFTVKAEGFPVSGSSRRFGDMIVTVDVEDAVNDLSTQLSSTHISQSSPMPTDSSSSSSEHCYSTGFPLPIGKREMKKYPYGTYYKWSCCDFQAKNPNHHR